MPVLRHPFRPMPVRVSSRDGSRLLLLLLLLWSFYGDASVRVLRGRPERRGGGCGGLCNLSRGGLAQPARRLLWIHAGSWGFGHGPGNGGGLAVLLRGCAIDPSERVSAQFGSPLSSSSTFQSPFQSHTQSLVGQVVELGFETPDGSLQLFVHQESLPPSMTAKHLMPGLDPPPFRASYPATGGSTALSLEWPVRPGALPWSWSMMALTPR